MLLTTIFFDLDDTLYPASSGLWPAIKQRINLYMHERLGVSWEEIPILRQSLFETYGTTLRGLEANFSLDRADYLAYVHDLPLTDYIGPDAELRAALETLPERKFIFTNSDRAHAQRVLAVLQVESFFTGIVDTDALAPHCKPQPRAFETALRLAGECEPRRCVLIDDLPHTTRAARDYGFLSILYGRDGPSPDADATLTRWRDLPALLDGRRP